MASESGFVRLSAVVAKNTFGSLERGSPQNGSIRRECLDHVIVFHENSLRRTLNSYLDYYHRSRTHLSLGKDSPEPRSIQPPEMGSGVAVSQVGGLHHRYERRTPRAPALLNIGVGKKLTRDPSFRQAKQSWTYEPSD